MQILLALVVNLAAILSAAATLVAIVRRGQVKSEERSNKIETLCNGNNQRLMDRCNYQADLLALMPPGEVEKAREVLSKKGV